MSFFKPSRHNRDASSASSRLATRALWRWVFIIADSTASRVLPVPTVVEFVDDFEGGAPVVVEDVDAAPGALDAGCQRKPQQQDS